MEWFNITWIFGIITIACAFFFLQMLMEYNRERGQITPKLRKIREIRKRHEAEMEKVDELSKEAEEIMSGLNSELDAVKAEAAELEAEIEASKNPSEA